MSTTKRVLVVGAGGLGSPVLRLLAEHDLELTVVDDDVVEESNLHRQTLYAARDVGEPKVQSVARALAELSPAAEVRTFEGRVLPTSAMELFQGRDLVVEGADNLATKFLVADAARLSNVPVVQAGAVRWGGWALCSTPQSACLRCLFEDIPRDRVETCAEAGVVGPVVCARRASGRTRASAPRGRACRRRALALRRATGRASQDVRASSKRLPALRRKDSGPAGRAVHRGLRGVIDARISRDSERNEHGCYRTHSNPTPNPDRRC